MKEYKYTINGNKFEVAIGEIVDNIATLTVNGEEFKVEMEKEEKPHPQPLPRREGGKCNLLFEEEAKGCFA